ncbi:MAG: hypothetical protein [Cressdnaviricota sp.]|nr:MAG: hypothetical protein [Cressdnaviricota sp.]
MLRAGGDIGLPPSTELPTTSKLPTTGPTGPETPGAETPVADYRPSQNIARVESSGLRPLSPSQDPRAKNARGSRVGELRWVPHQYPLVCS